MKIEGKLFKEILRQSRINVDGSEEDEIVRLLDLADETTKKLKEAKVETVKKVYELELEFLREDEVKPSMNREEALKNAPDKDSLSFIVPRVVE